MDILVWVRNMLGVKSSAPVVLYAISNLVLALLSVLCIINIIWYFYIRYFLNNNEFLLNQMKKRKWFRVIINLYLKTNMTFILFEILLYVISMGTIIQTSLKIIYYS